MSDKITPEQLRKEAVAVERMHGETLTVDWRTKQAGQLRAHAAAMEELDAALSAAKAEAEVADLWREKAKRAEAELAVARDELEVVRHGHRKVCDRMNNAEAELAKLRQKLMRYEHAEAADILHPPQDEQARADLPGEK